MPVLARESRTNLETELTNRYIRLVELLKPRDLTTAREGVRGRGVWKYPEQMCATKGSASELRIAVADFKTILTELGKMA